MDEDILGRGPQHDDDDEDEIGPLEALLKEEIVAGPPGKPDRIKQGEPIPAATPETMICLRGCKHYVEILTRFQAGNPKGTFDKPPQARNRFCKAIPSSEIDLTDELVEECNLFEPLTAIALLKRKRALSVSLMKEAPSWKIKIKWIWKMCWTVLRKLASG